MTSTIKLFPSIKSREPSPNVPNNDAPFLERDYCAHSIPPSFAECWSCEVRVASDVGRDFYRGSRNL